MAWIFGKWCQKCWNRINSGSPHPRRIFRRKVEPRRDGWEPSGIRLIGITQIQHRTDGVRLCAPPSRCESATLRRITQMCFPTLQSEKGERVAKRAEKLLASTGAWFGVQQDELHPQRPRKFRGRREGKANQGWVASLENHAGIGGRKTGSSASSKRQSIPV